MVWSHYRANTGVRCAGKIFEMSVGNPARTDDRSHSNCGGPQDGFYGWPPTLSTKDRGDGRHHCVADSGVALVHPKTPQRVVVTLLHSPIGHPAYGGFFFYKEHSLATFRLLFYDEL